MNGPLRSKRGCWTCRLRKKKCDEGRPHCLTCNSLSITCYGFGPKPDWMDNDFRERAVANSLKEIVKHTSRRKVMPEFPKQGNSTIKIAPKISNSSLENPSLGLVLSRQLQATAPSDHISSQDGPIDPSLLHLGDRLNPESIYSIPADESALLMHYLDNVFQLQYPIYKPAVLEGGRGWLLRLLLRSQSLRYATLALSAYHCRMTIIENISRPCRVAAIIQQEKYLESCIKIVNQFAQHSCPFNAIGVANSVIQLAFFELFTSHSNAWQPHLRAAIHMYQRGYERNYANFGLAEQSIGILCEDLSLSGYEPIIAEEVASFRFFGGTIIWLDITVSITAGTAPYLLSRHSCVLTSNSQTKLEKIMGCKNWVMLQIGRIAALHERKTQSLQQETFDCVEFEQTACDISREIQCGFTQGALEDFNISEHNSTSTLNTILDPSTLVTRIFGYMASLYLHLVVNGFENLDVLDTTMSRVMRMLQAQIPNHLLPALVCPLYVIGSVARKDDELFFRAIFSSPPLLDPVLSHRERILPILEGIWSRRRTTPGFSWQNSLELTKDILII